MIRSRLGSALMPFCTTTRPENRLRPSKGFAQPTRPSTPDGSTELNCPVRHASPRHQSGVAASEETSSMLVVVPTTCVRSNGATNEATRLFVPVFTGQVNASFSFEPLPGHSFQASFTTWADASEAVSARKMQLRSSFFMVPSGDMPLCREASCRRHRNPAAVGTLSPYVLRRSIGTKVLPFRSYRYRLLIEPHVRLRAGTAWQSAPTPPCHVLQFAPDPGVWISTSASAAPSGLGGLRMRSVLNTRHIGTSHPLQADAPVVLAWETTIRNA